MKYRYFFYGAGVVFLAIGAVALYAQNPLAAAVNGLAGAIFLFLGYSPPRRS